jgi:glyoxylase-like metal-dependent hydrolase (beta-lactamase superfamily II)
MKEKCECGFCNEESAQNCLNPPSCRPCDVVLIKCKTCGASYSEKLSACPDCKTQLSEAKEKENSSIILQMQVGHMAVFAYLVGDPRSGEALVIDPAAETENIIAVAEKNNLKIKYIVNTHGHVDHTSGNDDMKRLTGAKIIVHEDDAGRLANPSPAMLAMFAAKASPPADITVKEGDRIEIGDVSLKVIHTPGHSMGSMSLYMEGVVFTGDTLFVEGVGRTDFPGSSWPMMYGSIKEKLFKLPDKTKVLPGHNYGMTPTSTIGHEKRYNPFIT